MRYIVNTRKRTSLRVTVAPFYWNGINKDWVWYSEPVWLVISFDLVSLHNALLFMEGLQLYKDLKISKHYFLNWENENYSKAREHDKHKNKLWKHSDAMDDLISYERMQTEKNLQNTKVEKPKLCLETRSS